MEQLIALSKEAIFVIIIASMPAIAASLIVGILVALFSATTQIQEQTLSFAPKMIAVYLALIAFAAPLGKMILEFSRSCFLNFTLLP
ncbi:MAG: flagellar biosynthetic protein FliQ [Myxococcales bacterium]|nr:flagellar biosynthetic protein FliQ [Myxococcales bacterium]USN49870.1 MAG: flagellar biosynthetic protein FliQ [Myxococcales bacterium]